MALVNGWYCSICTDELGNELIPGTWSEDESEWIEDAPPQWDEVTPFPEPCYACAWEDCGAAITYDAADLWFYAGLTEHSAPAGFYCETHLDEINWWLDFLGHPIPAAGQPTLADVLAAERA